MTKPTLHEMQKHRQLQQEYYREIQPYIQMMVRIHNVLIPTMTVYPDGRIDSHYEYSPEVLSMLDALDRVLDDVRKRYESLFQRI